MSRPLVEIPVRLVSSKAGRLQFVGDGVVAPCTIWVPEDEEHALRPYVGRRLVLQLLEPTAEDVPDAPTEGT